MARKVLLADDSVTAQNMGRRIMTDAGYEVITVNNGSAALKKIHESRPDLIVLDVYMPGYGGLEVCQRLKENEVTMKIPVLLTVGKMEPFKVEEAKRVRADGHIIKPFDASELLSALTKLEDKIVPSENGRGRRGKSEAKKSRSTAEVADPAVNFDDSHTEQIEHLARVKQRSQAEQVAEEAPSSPVEQPFAEATPASEEAARVIASAPPSFETETYQSAPSRAEQEAIPEPNEDSVTFASGPIYEPEEIATPSFAPPAEEFEIQREPEIESEQQPSSETSSSSYIAEPDLERSSSSEVCKGDTIAEVQTEPGLVAEGVRDYSSHQPEPAQRWVAENVAHSSEEAARSLEEEMQQAQIAAEPAAIENGPDQAYQDEPQPTHNWTPEPEPQFESSAQPAQESDSGAAFAAAASASESFAQTNAVSASTSEPESPAGSESSAAWDNWQRIRETVITERATEAIAESAAAMADAAVSAQLESSTSETAQEAPPSHLPSGNDALSSIVDNVLAELKPRLLAEIAKQLAQDKK